MNILWHLLVFPFYVILTRSDAGILPAANRRLTAWGVKPTLGIVHDLSQFHVEEKYDVLRTFYVKHVLPRLISSLDFKVCISESTRKDVTKYWHIESHNLHVIYNGYDKSRYNVVPPLKAKAVKDHYGIDRPYIIYVSRLEHPGKNHCTLIDAFERLSERMETSVDLVLAGGDWNGADVIKQRIANSPLKAHIKQLGYVPTEHLPTLYHQAKLMVFPSLYEGFGIPLVEAMACGTATCCSNRSALAEVAGNASLCFNPENAEDITDQMHCALTNTRARQALIKRGLERAADFSWDTLANGICALIRGREKTVIETIRKASNPSS